MQISNIGNQLPVREQTTKIEITKKVRECHNKLTVTCENTEIIDKFIAIIENKGINTFEEYNNYRNLCRKELGMEKQLEFNNNKVFFIRVTTEDLDKAHQ